ncbi:MAG TPA: SnoaL-like domain-containing protein [Mucilaginibacter sp.]|jgi:hypothetical protein|nr:SnoaL-like domain-containing protein [Mucilaginibacter sp.]
MLRRSKHGGQASAHRTSTELSVTLIFLSQLIKHHFQTITIHRGFLFMFTIHEIANGLKEMVSEQKFVDAYQLLFSEDAESIDPLNTSGQPLKGLATLLAREKDFLSRIIAINKITLSEPIIAGSYFTLSLKMSFEVKGQGHMEVEEICLYKVKDGKIISQQFFIG